METLKIAVRGSTQGHLEIFDIMDDLVVLKDGSVSLIIRVSAVNFGLLSEKEQEAIIYAYAGTINSLNFSVQILVRSQQKDISHYLSLLEEEEKKQTNPLLKDQITHYREFIGKTVKENNVLDKKFYVVIPFSSLELGITKPGKNGLPLPIKTIIERGKIALLPKRDHLLRQLGRLGLKSQQLTTAELIELFYEIYNQSKITEKNGQKFENIKTI